LELRRDAVRDDLRPMDRAAVLTAFNEQVRQATAPDGTGASFEKSDVVVRRLAPSGQEGSGIFWTDLDAGNADAVIAGEVAIFAARGEEFEWKLYDYDQPADLGERLRAAGFAAEAPESFMVAEAAAVAAELKSAAEPAGVRIERVTDPAGVARMNQVSEAVFAEDRSELTQSILAQLATAPDMTGLFVAMAGDLPVSSARIEFLPHCEFAGLWGGGTLAEWRGRGIYRALVRSRAELAVQRGYAYLTVDASPDSRPILERLGFIRLAVTTPYIWAPAG
jgi:GNAT superfamily N-acetyltransferase